MTNSIAVFPSPAGAKAPSAGLQHIDALVHSIDAILWEAEVESLKFSFVSQGAVRLLGYPIEAWHEEGFWIAHTHPEDRENVVRYCALQIAADADFSFEYRMLSRSGQEVRLRTSASVVTQDGVPRSLRGVTVNLGAEKSTKHLVADQHHFLWQLVDAIPSPIFWKDTEGRYGGCNKAFETYIGMGRNDLIGKTVFDIAPHDLAQVYAAADQELLDRRDSQIYEADVKYADGSRRGVMFHKATFTRPDHELGGLVGVMLDITDRRRAEEALRLSSTVFERSAEGITLTDHQGLILRTNRAFQEITGYSEDEVVGKPPGEALRSGTHDQEFYADMWRCLEQDGHWSGEIVNRRKSGELFCERLSITRVDDAEGKPANYIGIFSDLTEANDAKRKIEQLSYFDALTGLPNRVILAERLEAAIDQRQGRLMALLTIDVGGLAHVNDTLGHHYGDKLILSVAQRLGQSLAGNARLYRHAGKGYAVILEGFESPETAGVLAEKLLALLHRPFQLDQHPVTIDPHIGISLYPGDGQDPASLLKNADVALHCARNEGLSGYEFFKAEMNHAAMERMLIETRLPQALQHREFQLHFQPQVDLRTGRVAGMEALVRWFQPELGTVSPARFIPVAESSSLIIDLGHWVLQEACRAAQAMRQAGHPDLKVAVNVSARQFSHEDFAEQVQAALAETGLPAQCLELELTESLIMQRPEQVVRVMVALKSLGITFSVDDFGTGYSSLSQLRRFPIDTLKIDRSFIHDITESSDGAVITQAVIALGKSLHLDIIAEGVETEAQKRFLMENGCHCIQGFLFSRPLPEKAMAELLERSPGRHPKDDFQSFSI